MAYWSSPASTLVALPFPPPLFVTLPLYPSRSLPPSLSVVASQTVPLSLPRPRGSFSRFCQCAIPVAIFHQRPATTPLFILPPRPVAPPTRAYARSKLFMPFTSDLRLNVSVVRSVDGGRRAGKGGSGGGKKEEKKIERRKKGEREGEKARLRWSIDTRIEREKEREREREKKYSLATRLLTTTSSGSIKR